MKERKVFCARWLFCEALARVAVAVVVVCVELVVEVVLKSDFCAGCCSQCAVCRRGGGEKVGGREAAFWVEVVKRCREAIGSQTGLEPTMFKLALLRNVPTATPYCDTPN